MGMETKYTPGPWRIGTPGSNGCYTVGTESGLMVAMVAHSANQLDQCEQAIGDARLIAAAPTQHAALLHADACFQAALLEGWAYALADGDINRIRDIWSRHISAAFGPVPMAIAKAEGR